MKIRDLVISWEQHAGGKLVEREYSIRLPLHDVARIMALAEMFPARTETQIITELLGSALDELVEAFPYAKGAKIIAKDEYDDPMYEDVGLTPIFFDKPKKFLRRLESELEHTSSEQP